MSLVCLGHSDSDLRDLADRPHFLSLLLHNYDCVRRWLQIMREDVVLHTLVMLLDTSAHTPYLANLGKCDYVQ